MELFWDLLTRLNRYQEPPSPNARLTAQYPDIFLHVSARGTPLTSLKPQKGLLARLERVESRLQEITVTNQLTINAINTLRVDVNKMLELQN